MAQTAVIEGTVTGKGASASIQKSVHDSLTKTIQAELQGQTILPPHGHASFHGSIVYDKA
jgi:hypothetical protein